MSPADAARLIRSARVEQLRRQSRCVLDERTESGVVVGMFTGDGWLSYTAALTGSGTDGFDDIRDLVLNQAPHEVMVVAIAPMRSAPPIWQRAELLAEALADIAATSAVYTQTLCAPAPVIDLGSTDHTTWRG